MDLKIRIFNNKADKATIQLYLFIPIKMKAKMYKKSKTE